MYITYHDILERISDTPLWWLDGMPRYTPFVPRELGVYHREAALVLVQCHCGTRYKLGVHDRGKRGGLRTDIILNSELSVVGDPPNACNLPRGCGCASMSALQIEVLEFWSKEGRPFPKWVRDTSMERPLVDADLDGRSAPRSLSRRIHDSDLKDDWKRAREEGDFAEMVSILTTFECERAMEVAHVLDWERRHVRALIEASSQVEALRRGRFGED